MSTDVPGGYAVRRLNPFLGVIEVVDTDDARALSSDGVSWQIQVLAERPEHTWGSLNQHPSTPQYFRFGAWSPNEGLVRVPLNPLLDIGAMLAAVEPLLPLIEASLDRLPFPLRDRFELWLLDSGQRPLALLGSTVEERFLAEVHGESWQASPPAGRAFESAVLARQGLAGFEPGPRRRHADYLERRVRERAAVPARTRWFRREDDGLGWALATEDIPSAPVLTGGAFPPLGLSAYWEDVETAAVVRDYFDWCAPRLLTLTGLSESERDRLEHAARRQSRLVEQQYRLYPQILNPELIDAARVEARLRRTEESA